MDANRQISHRIRISLSIPPDKYKAYYAGEIKYILARSNDGRTVKFPAGALRRFVSHGGVTGEFEIEVDRDNRLKHIRRIK